MHNWFVAVGILLLLAGVMMGLSDRSQAARYTSPNYTIDASIDNSFGGSVTGDSYQLVASGGESIVGNGTGGSYILDQGYVAQLTNSLQLTVDPDSIDFEDEIIPGNSRQADTTVSILTDAPGYSLAINQTGDLSDGNHTIPGIGATIASPTAWDEGNTKGLGVSLASTNATALPGKWNSGNSYAALPSTATTIYSRTGFSGGSEDNLTLRYRLDVTASQASGAYTTTAVYTGTILP